MVTTKWQKIKKRKKKKKKEKKSREMGQLERGRVKGHHFGAKITVAASLQARTFFAATTAQPAQRPSPSTISSGKNHMVTTSAQNGNNKKKGRGMAETKN